MGIDVWVHEVLLITFVGIQQSMFKLTIKSNVLDAMVKPTNMNLFTQLWHIPLIIKILSYFFLAYFKLLEIAMVQVLGSMEDVHCFNFSVFKKSKLCTQLTNNLCIVVRIFYHFFFTLHNFSYTWIMVWQTSLILGENFICLMLLAMQFFNAKNKTIFSLCFVVTSACYFFV